MASFQNHNRCSFYWKDKVCGESRGKDEMLSLSECNSDVSNHLRFCNMSRSGNMGKITEWQLILARAGKFNISEKELLQTKICSRHRQSLGKYWSPPKTCQFPEHEGRKTTLHSKRAVNLEISEKILKLFGVTVAAGSRKFNEPCKTWLFV